MDAPIPLARLIEESNALLGAEDFEGAEDLLASGLGRARTSDIHLHFYLGKLYRRWNKLTSAANHLGKSAELAFEQGDELLLLQVVEELKAVRQQQALQSP